MLSKMDSAYVFTVTSANFEAEVAQKSHEVPILLDFWAEWCEPCKALAPTLERVADDYAGAFLVGKVDTEVEARIAEAFGVKSIPFAALLVQGQPVDAFSGAIDERALRDFLAKSGVQPLEPVDESEPVDPDGAEARYGAAIDALRAGAVSVASERLEGIADDDDRHADAERIRQGLPVYEFREAVADSKAEQALLRGADLLRSGQARGAVEELLESVATDKTIRDGLARRAILMCFLIIGEGAEGEGDLSAMRRRLATLVY